MAYRWNRDPGLNKKQPPSQQTTGGPPVIVEPTWKERQKEILDNYFCSLRALKFDSKKRDFVASSNLQEATKRELGAIYERAAPVAELILRAGEVLVEHGVQTFEFGIPLSYDTVVTDDGLQCPVGPEQYLPEWSLLIGYPVVITHLVKDKTTQKLLLTETLSHYTIFEGVVILTLLYYYIYTVDDVLGPYDELLKVYKTKVKACLNILPLLNSIPAPVGKKDFIGTEAEVIEFKRRLDEFLN